MKPNFALTLSFDGIGLLKRAPGGWLRAGEASLDQADLSAALADLRATAQSLDGPDFRSKIVIPNEQIRYLTIASDGIDDADLPQAVARALDGATPYAVRELTYDFARDGAVTHIAAVAQETLDEAEGFAVENGFQPVSFVAIPAPGDFAGEPFLGVTRSAARWLPEGDSLSRDLQPIRIIGTVDAAPAPADMTAPAPAPADMTAPVAALPEPAQTVAAPDQPMADAAPGLVTQGAAPEPELQQRPEPQVPPVQQSDPRADDALFDDDARMSDAQTPDDLTPDDLNSEDQTPEEPEPDNAAADPIHDLPPDPAVLGGTLRAIDEGGAGPVAFASIRARRDGPPPPAPARSIRATAPIIDIDEQPNPPPRLAPVSPADTAAGVMAQAGRIGALFSRRDVGAPPEPAPAPARRAAILRDPAQAAVPAGPASERDRMTVFGARKPEKSQTAALGAKPRYLGLILTAALLVFLLGVAAMAAIFSDDVISRVFGPRDADPVVAAIDQTYDDPYLVEGDEAELQDEGLDLAALDPGAFGEATGIRADDMPGAGLPDALSVPVIEPALSPEEIAARYAATGIWQQAPEAPATPGYSQLDDLYVASIDGSVTETDAVALPAPGTLLGDRVPGAQSSPAAAGTLFAFDPRGLVIATPEGALSPDGVVVYSGRPEVLPAAFPTRFAETPAEVSDAFAGLRDPRPRARPDDLAQQTERSQLGGLTRSELAQLRPRLRPDLPPRVVQPTPEPEPEQETAAPPAETGTELAVGESVKPRMRPRGFDRTVAEARAREAAQAQAVAAAVAQARATPAAKPAVVAAPAPKPTTRNSRVQPEEEDEPEIAQASARSVAPRVPSSASVAREATVRNALPLNRMNLIGVYGKPSARSALIRMSNGRYRKVKVGDTLDGGRVSAIGDGELRYTKGGRQITLNMPRG